MISVLLERLTNVLNFEYDGHFTWDEHTVYEDEVAAYIEAGKKGTDLPYSDIGRHQATHKSKEYHIARVVWFVINPEEIKGIAIDNLCGSDCIYPKAIIEDGHHRFMAAQILKMDKIKIEYSGREDIERYLQGKRKNPPKNVLR